MLKVVLALYAIVSVTWLCSPDCARASALVNGSEAQGQNARGPETMSGSFGASNNVRTLGLPRSGAEKENAPSREPQPHEVRSGVFGPGNTIDNTSEEDPDLEMQIEELDEWNDSYDWDY